MGWMALLNEKNDKIGVVGDIGWDSAMQFVDNFISIYMKHFSRFPTKEEINSSIDFVYDTCCEYYVKED